MVTKCNVVSWIGSWDQKKKDIRTKYVQNKGSLNTSWTSINNALVLVY